MALLPKPEEKTLLTPEEVEAKFGLTRRVQDRLRKRRMIPYVKLTPGRGGRIFYDVEDVYKFLLSRRVDAS